MGKRGPVELGDMEYFSEVLEKLWNKDKEVTQTFQARDPEHVQEAFGHSAEFSTAWAASIAAIDQAYTDGHLAYEEQKTALYAYLYEFLGSVYERAEVRQLGENQRKWSLHWLISASDFCRMRGTFLLKISSIVR